MPEPVLTVMSFAGLAVLLLIVFCVGFLWGGAFAARGAIRWMKQHACCVCEEEFRDYFRLSKSDESGEGKGPWR